MLETEKERADRIDKAVKQFQETGEAPLLAEDVDLDFDAGASDDEKSR